MPSFFDSANRVSCTYLSLTRIAPMLSGSGLKSRTSPRNTRSRRTSNTSSRILPVPTTRRICIATPRRASSISVCIFCNASLTRSPWWAMSTVTVEPSCWRLSELSHFGQLRVDASTTMPQFRQVWCVMTSVSFQSLREKLAEFLSAS